MGQTLGTALQFCRPQAQRATHGHGATGQSGMEGLVFDGDGEPLRQQTAVGGAPSPVELVPQRLPTKITDAEQSKCYCCEVKFDVLVRRHHCRRCRNIYCQKCSSSKDRVLMYGEVKPVRLCHKCAEATPAENHFVEWHVPLLLKGATFMRQSLLERRPVHVRVTADLSWLQEIEEAHEGDGRGSTGGSGDGGWGGGGRRGGGGSDYDQGGVVRRHPLDEVDSVEADVDRNTGGWGWGWGGGGGKGGEMASGGRALPCAMAIRLRGKGQLTLEACSQTERDLWVSALGEAVHRRQTPCFAKEVEEERWARKENAAYRAQKRLSAEKRAENEASRTRMAVKYGLDPAKYASRESTSPVESCSGVGGRSGAGRGNSSFGIGGMGGGLARGAGFQVLSTVARLRSIEKPV